MSFFDVVDGIKERLKNVAARDKYTKLDIAKIIDPNFYKEIYYDEALVKRVIPTMPETDFCKVTEVEGCEGGRYGACTCIKTVVFGEDEINGKICEKFTTRATSSRCMDGNLELAGRCRITPEAFPCEEMFVDKDKEISELKDANEALIEKLARAEKELEKVCVALDLEEDCFL